jgi:hypothetical protein
MRKREDHLKKTMIVFSATCAILMSSGLALAQDAQPLGFFVTSAGPGEGADLGGLAGADAHCQSLADGAGAGDRTWSAYLSTQGPNAVNARDRIGTGPWYNALGTLVGNNVDELHGMGHRFTVMTVIDEVGRRIPGSGYAPNRHDVLTGTSPDGTAFAAGEDMTCNNWTSSGDGSAMLGHHDRAAWNSAHGSQGCSQVQLRATGGDGLFYCFAQ